MTDLSAWLDHFELSEAQQVAETGIATVWKVRWRGGAAALKIYKGGNMQDEAPGVAFLQAAGGGAARIHGVAEGAILMEWLDGPSLGDLVRRGDVTAADRALAEMVRDLGPVPEAAAFKRPESWIAALLDNAETGAFGQAREIAVTLLRDPRPYQALHGDLHHDNVMQGTDGWRAIDAKGVIGERSYELANGFRNPVGAEEIWRDPAQVRRRLADWSKALHEPPGRMMSWAVVHLALSILWDDGGPDHVDYPMIEVFLGVLGEQVPG